MNPKQSRLLSRIIHFGVIWGSFGLVYVLIEYGLLGDSTIYPSTKNLYDFDVTLFVTPAISFVMGILIGMAETFFVNRIFTNKPFWEKLIFKSTLYLLSIVTLLISVALIVNSIRMDSWPFDEKVLRSIGMFTGNFAFWSIVIYCGVATVLTLFIAEVSDYLGGSVLNNFFTGKYHRPQIEQRIFMFLDIRSSTTIAEQLGHVKYFQLLNKYYADIADPILTTQGEVYQYAGDEIIITWKLRKGLIDNNCVRCFFMIKETLASLQDEYIKEFGLSPGFKAGLHCGEVTTGEIGQLKKELFFTGDVLNSTARIQASCNELKTDILLSEDMKSHLQLEEDYQIIEKGIHQLRGREQRLKLFSLEKNDNN